MGACQRQFYLHEGGGRSSGLAMTPAAERGVGQAVLAGEGRGGQTAPLKRAQQMGAPGSRGSVFPKTIG